MNKVLIIDDDLFAIKILEDILKEEYNVLCTRKGKDGIDIAKEEKPSLILLDIEMPDMDGFEVLKTLKRDKATKSIPVIFLTGIIDPRYEEKGFIHGAVDYIGKPYNRNVVKVRVKTQIEIFEYHQNIERQLKLDAVTQINNRRGIEEYLKEVWVKAKNKKFELSFIIIDIDHFKMVNDTYGHVIGDSILQAIASIIKEVIPETLGYIGRYGGEEFSVILEDKSRKEAEQLILDVKNKVYQKKILNEKSPVSKYLTISAGGITKVPEEGEKLLDFISKADKMLYKSKSEGRNRFYWYE